MCGYAGPFLERVRQDLSQERLAEMVSLHPRTIQKNEAGKVNILFTTIMRFQRALRCPWETLLGKPWSRSPRPLLHRARKGAKNSAQKGLPASGDVGSNRTIEWWFNGKTCAAWTRPTVAFFFAIASVCGKSRSMPPVLCLEAVNQATNMML